jgi:hypothetical protein
MATPHLFAACPKGAVTALLVAWSGTLVADGAWAGEVTVSFPNQARYADAGTTRADEQATLDTLARHLRALGKRLLPADQQLTVEVLDVDLAGTVRPARRTGQDIRIANGGADGPHLTLRYSLQARGQPLASGEESLADMDYVHRFQGGRSADPLQHEKQMLETWFKARIVERRAAAD